MGYDHDHGRGGWGGDPEPGTYIYNIYIYMYINRYRDTFCFNIKKNSQQESDLLIFHQKKKRRCLAGPTPARAWHQWSKDQPKQQPNRGMRLFECSQKDPCTWRRHQRYEFATKSRLRLERDVALGTSNGPIVDKF